MTEGAAVPAAPSPPRVLNLCAGADTGGQAWRLTRAFERHSSWHYDSVVASRNYIDYPMDNSWDNALVDRLWSEADVLHLNTWVRPFASRDRRWPRPLVIHHHGTAFREHGAELYAQGENAAAVQVVATVDLLRYGADLTLLPSPFDLGELMRIRRREYRRGDAIRIAHAPTDRLVKGTAEVIAVVDRLSKRYPIELDLIEGVSHAECLARKARADIFIDQLELGYGNNAIEAWGMGIPVICGVTDPWTRAKMLELWGELPFVDATAGLEDVLEELVVSKPARTAAGKAGAAHAKAYHDERVVVELAQQLYARAMDKRPAIAGGWPARSLGSASRGTPYRPAGMVLTEVAPGMFRYLRPAQAARYALRAS